MKTIYQNTIRVYAEDVDFMGIVYHSNYLCYLERSRTEVLRSYNCTLSTLRQAEVLFAISELSINYKAPARLDDLLTIESIVDELKPCSIVFNQKIKNAYEHVLCEAKVKVVCVNAQLKPQKLPPILIGLKS